MLNINKMYDLFESIEKMVNNYDFFAVQRWDGWKSDMLTCTVDDEPDVKTIDEITLLEHEYRCNNDNTLVFVYNMDNDEYLVCNYEFNHRIITQNAFIECIDDAMAYSGLDKIFDDLCTNEYAFM